MQFLALHAVALKFLLLEVFRHISIVHRQHVVRNDITGEIKPEPGHLGEYSPLVRNLVLQDVVKGRDTVCSHHYDAVISLINLANFTGFKRFVRFH